MSRILRALVGCAVATLFVMAPAPLSAQEAETMPVPLVQVSVGYTFMRDFSDELPRDVNFPAGWYFSGAVNPYQWIGFVGEATGSYRNHFNVDVGEGWRLSNKARVYTLMGGPRFFHKTGRFAPFAQVLAGVAHMRLKTTFLDGLAPVGTASGDATDFAIQPGAGLTVYLTERVGLRASADYRLIIDFLEAEKNEYSNEFRVSTGFTLHWGGR